MDQKLDDTGYRPSTLCAVLIQYYIKQHVDFFSGHDYTLACLLRGFEFTSEHVRDAWKLVGEYKQAGRDDAENARPPFPLPSPRLDLEFITPLLETMDNLSDLDVSAQWTIWRTRAPALTWPVSDTEVLREGAPGPVGNNRQLRVIAILELLMAADHHLLHGPHGERWPELVGPRAKEYMTRSRRDLGDTNMEEQRAAYPEGREVASATDLACHAKALLEQDLEGDICNSCHDEMAAEAHQRRYPESVIDDSDYNPEMLAQVLYHHIMWFPAADFFTAYEFKFACLLRAFGFTLDHIKEARAGMPGNIGEPDNGAFNSLEGVIDFMDDDDYDAQLLLWHRYSGRALTFPVDETEVDGIKVGNSLRLRALALVEVMKAVQVKAADPDNEDPPAAVAYNAGFNDAAAEDEAAYEAGFGDALAENANEDDNELTPRKNYIPGIWLLIADGLRVGAQHYNIPEDDKEDNEGYIELLNEAADFIEANVKIDSGSCSGGVTLGTWSKAARARQDADYKADADVHVLADKRPA